MHPSQWKQAEEMTEKMISMPIGVVVRRTPGVTRWAKHAWRAALWTSTLSVGSAEATGLGPPSSVRFVPRIPEQ